MTAHAQATFEVKGWDEQPYGAIEGLPKLTRASVKVAFMGAIEGEGTIEYLMAYREDGSASFVGVQRVIGTLDGRAGSFVLTGTGGYEKSTGTASMDWTVAPGSGTGALLGLRGTGSAVATHQPPGALMLDYDLD
jgi:hypothetical protein